MKWYLIKVAGSGGIIFDFSKAEVADDEKLITLVKELGGVPDSMKFRYNCFDERIKMHSWSLLADTKGYEQQHMVWIYSPTNEKPELSECETNLPI